MTIARTARWLIAGGVMLLAANCSAFYAARPRFSGRSAQPRPQRVIRKPVIKPVDPRQGKLGWPVPGTVVGSFGLVIDPRYGTKTKKLGVDIRCAPGSPVKAAYPGKVSFADRFMGYGLTVIVDHGQRLHTIYSRLADISTAVGRDVKEGELLGHASDTLHCQVRMEGQSVDPEQWLRPR